MKLCNKKPCKDCRNQVARLQATNEYHVVRYREMEEKLKLKETDRNLQLKILEAKERLIRSIGQMNEAVARIVEPGTF